jgi:hypothetical protein
MPKKTWYRYAVETLTPSFGGSLVRRLEKSSEAHARRCHEQRGRLETDIFGGA